MRVDWYLARIGDRCGNCGTRQPALTPMRRLRTGGLRCAACAKHLLGEDVPGDLAADEARLRPMPPTTHARPLQPLVERLRRQLRPDGKARAAGDQ